MAFHYIALRSKTNEFPLPDLKEEEGPRAPFFAPCPPAGLWKKALGRLGHLSGHPSPEHDVKLLRNGSGIEMS